MSFPINTNPGPGLPLDPPPHTGLPTIAVAENPIGTHLFEVLTGPAGCGKSTLCLDYMAQHPDGDAVLTSSTGISAVNLGDATTINTFCQYFDVASLRDRVVGGRVQAILRRCRKGGLRRILLDEMSMISSETLDLLVYAIDEVNSDIEIETGLTQGRNERIGLTLVGDVCQLPPVQGQYCFEAGCWEAKFAPHIHRLTRIWRQDDPAFVEGLRAARRGEAQAVADYFGPRTALTTDNNFPGTTVFATNAEVDRWNGLKHAQLTTKPVSFDTVRTGEQKAEWKKEIPEVVGLKPGARVMILSNEFEADRSRLLYANGDLGTFHGLTEQEVEVAGDWRKVPMAVVELLRGEVVGVPFVTRRYEVPTGNLGVKQPKVQVLGTVRYMPLRLAYASSVHKTQGLSMDKVQIAIAHRFFASPAMLYVGLSRARTMAGLRLVGTPELIKNRCSTDPKVAAWL